MMMTSLSLPSSLNLIQEKTSPSQEENLFNTLDAWLRKNRKKTLSTLEWAYDYEDQKGQRYWSIFYYLNGKQKPEKEVFLQKEEGVLELIRSKKPNRISLANKNKLQQSSSEHPIFILRNEENLFFFERSFPDCLATTSLYSLDITLLDPLQNRILILDAHEITDLLTIKTILLNQGCLSEKISVLDWETIIEETGCSSFQALDNNNRILTHDLKSYLKEAPLTTKEEEEKEKQEEIERSKELGKNLLEKKQKEIEVQKYHESLTRRWNHYQHPPQKFPYLIKKQIDSYQLKYTAYSNEPALVVPLYTLLSPTSFLLKSFQFILSNGEKRFEKGHKNDNATFYPVGKDLNESDIILFCEGAATAHTIASCVPYSVISCGPISNLEPVIRIFTQQFSNKKFLLCADNDWNENNKNPGLEIAQTILETLGVPYCLPIFKTQKKGDFNDLLCWEGQEEVIQQLSKALQSKASPLYTTIIPSGYRLSFDNTNGLEKGLYDQSLKKISPPIKILYESYDQKGKNNGKCFLFLDSQGNKKRITLENKLLSDPKETASTLLDAGFAFPTFQKQKNLLMQYFIQSKATPPKTTITKPGWVDKVFLLPSFITDATPFLMHDRPLLQGFESKGTPQEWQNNIEILCCDNALLTFVVCATLTPPLMALIAPEEKHLFGFNFFGSSSIGKTTLLELAQSIVGINLIHQWRTTDNAVESLFEARNALPCFLDEMAQADPKIIGETAYLFGNGEGKGRAKVTGEAKERKTWNHSILLSTGEEVSKQMTKAKGVDIKAGALMRILDIPAQRTYGIFDNIPDGVDSPQTLANKLKEKTKQFYGTPFVQFILSLQEKAFLPHLLQELKQAIGTHKKLFKETFDTNQDSSQIGRSLDYFSWIYATGCLAAETNVFSHLTQDRIFEACQDVFNSWVDQRGTRSSLEEQEFLETLIRFLTTHIKTHLGNLDDVKNNQDLNNPYQKQLKGYYALGDSPDKTIQAFYFDEANFTDLCGGKDKNWCLRVLQTQGFIQKINNRYVKQMRFRGEKRYFYEIKGAIIGNSPIDFSDQTLDPKEDIPLEF